MAFPEPDDDDLPVSSAEASAAAASAAAAAAKQRAAQAAQAAMAASSKPPSHPKDAVWHKGVAISMWQNSGDPMLSNWSQFVARKFPFGWLPIGLNRYQGPYSIHEVNPQSWDRYKEDIQLVKQLGCNAYRVSIEWARVEPRRGEIDQAAVDRYNDIFDELEANGIEPSVTLHHFTHPAWLDEWCNGFEGDASVEEFSRWASLCARLFGKRVRYWATFNEPTCSMFLGWITGMHTPGKIVHCGLAGRVLKNMLRAHRSAYDAIKAVDPSLQVGLVHHHIRFEAQGPKWLLWPAEYCCRWMNFWWGYELIHKWLLTGELEWSAPLGMGEGFSWRDPQGKPPLDWFGVNYYSRAVVSWYLKPTAKPGEIMTDMYYPVYAQGLYDALVQAKELDVPVYITETGCADKGDAIRPVMIDEYMRATLRAMRDGVDVRGFYYWTLLDNFEWNAGYIMEFGLFKWRPGGPRGGPITAVVDRVLKQGAKVLQKYYAELPDSVAGVLAVAKSMVFGEAGETAANGSAATAEKARLAAPGPSSSPLRHRSGAAGAAALAAA